MGTPQTTSGCAVTPEELAGLEAVLQLIRTVIDQVSYSTCLQQCLFVVTCVLNYFHIMQFFDGRNIDGFGAKLAIHSLQ